MTTSTLPSDSTTGPQDSTTGSQPVVLSAIEVGKPVAEGELGDLVDLYGLSQFLPPADWITRLKLVRPRRDVRCLSSKTLFWKRILDVSVSVGLLIAVGPVMVLVAIAVKLTSPGPVIFRQRRVGLNLRGVEEKPDRRQAAVVLPDGANNRRTTGSDRRRKANFGRPFTLYKFRTMRTDAEKNGAQFATAGDPRVTSIGRFLRKTRLDELPQLWNVLRGEMSLVGPRPERPEFIDKLTDEIPDYLNRLGLKPGLSGPAQVINGYDNNIESFRRKVALDLLYLQNCCLWNDIKILLRTVVVVLTGRGAL